MTAKVGGLEIPVPIGDLNSPVLDPTVSAILEFLSVCIRDGLNAKLSNMQGAAQDAVPELNCFAYDPSTYFVRNAVPALYVWSGKSTRQQRSLISDMRVREINALWLFSELLLPEDYMLDPENESPTAPRAGLAATVDAIFMQAAERGYHDLWSWNGDPLGTPLAASVGLIGWEFVEGAPGIYAPVPATAGPAEQSAEGHSLYAYPAAKALFRVYERIGGDEQTELNQKLGLILRASEEDPLVPGVHIRSDDDALS